MDTRGGKGRGGGSGTREGVDFDTCYDMGGTLFRKTNNCDADKALQLRSLPNMQFDSLKILLCLLASLVVYLGHGIARRGLHLSSSQNVVLRLGRQDPHKT